MKRLINMIIYVLAAAMILPYTVTAFASGSYVTKDESTGEIVYDIAGFAGSLGLSQDTAVTEGTFEELEGLSFHNGEQPLYWVARRPRVVLYPGGYGADYSKTIVR